MKRITILIPEDTYEALRTRSYEEKGRGVGEVVRNILLEVFQIENKLAQKVLQNSTPPKFKLIKESKKELEALVPKTVSSGTTVEEKPPKALDKSKSLLFE